MVLTSHLGESLSGTPSEHPGALYPLAPLSPQADTCPFPRDGAVGQPRRHPLLSLFEGGMTPVR